jgi:hypothetical protein
MTHSSFFDSLILDYMLLHRIEARQLGFGFRDLSIGDIGEYCQLSMCYKSLDPDPQQAMILEYTVLVSKSINHSKDLALVSCNFARVPLPCSH